MIRYSFFALLFFATQLHGAEQPDIHAANRLYQAGKLAEALTVYQNFIKVNPEHRNALYNGGLTAFLLRRFEVSRELWLNAERLNSEDIRVKEKLIQLYRQLGEEDEAVRRTAALTELRNNNSEYRRKTSFVCDQFSIGAERFMVFQHFDFPEAATKFTAYSLDNQEKTRYSIVFASNPTTNAIAHEIGELASDERLYQIEAYSEGGRTHETYLHTKTDFSYSQFKQQLVAIAEGKSRPISSTSR